ncbi:MAG: hypothetical protein Q7P63_01125 [Verrucomicrobiota bacterium JB022]|nr:hypothetical protein [Verrucomicrobiota bacterium JB022]
MIRLIDNPDAVAAKHTKVPTERRLQLVGFLRQADPDRLPYVLKTMQDNKIPEAELALVEDVLGVAKPAPTPAATTAPTAPKALSPSTSTETKESK